ncbi:MAG: hypothetical protein QME47_03040 [Candidatus Thermoplasmatota archaeon]|nr:hypothetical protein [Candidatus Thermoplasmatota archaeon]
MKKRIAAIEAAEQKYRALVEERDKFNRNAKLVGDEMRLLNDSKGALFKTLNELKSSKTIAIEKIKLHKSKRDELHKKAKELLSLRRSTRKKIIESLPEDLNELKKELEELEFKQQTMPLTLKEENKIINRIRAMIFKAKNLEAALEEQEQLSMELSNINTTIDELFKKADEEHAEVVKLSDEVKELNDKGKALFNEIAEIINKIKKKNKEYLELKSKADEFHKRALGMRATVIAFKKEERLRRELEREALEKRKLEVETQLSDKKELEKFIDKSLEDLKKKGKIEL